MILILQPGLSYRPAPGVPITEHARALRLYLWTKADGRCALCHNPIEPKQIHIDHIVPQSSGGEDGVHNLQATHRGCNAAKSNRSMAIAVAMIQNKSQESQPLVHRPRPAPTHRVLPDSDHGTKVPGLLRFRMRVPLSQRELAKISGVAASTIARIERGEDAHLKTVRLLAQALGKEPADLMELDK